MQPTFRLVVLLLLAGCPPHPPPPSLARPTCELPDSLYAGGAQGFCTEEGGQAFDLSIVDGKGALLMKVSWPDDVLAADAGTLSSIGCATLCEIGMIELMETTDKLRPGGSLSGAPRPPEPDAGTHSCYVAKNARQRYASCQEQVPFDCPGACGAGCIGCTVRVTSTHCGSPDVRCSERKLLCYTRKCCQVHDRALDEADLLPTTRQRVATRLLAHLAGAMNECGLDDASGDTWNLRESECFDFPARCLED